MIEREREEKKGEEMSQPISTVQIMCMSDIQ